MDHPRRKVNDSTGTDRICLLNFENFTFLGEGGEMGLKEGKIEERTSGSQAHSFHFIVKTPVY